jgi:hypothetical protein
VRWSTAPWYKEGKPAWLRFGIFNLLWHLEGVKVNEALLQDWAARLHSDTFRFLWRHFYQSFRKFNNAARNVARLQDIVDQGIDRHLEFVRRHQKGETTQEADPDHLTTMEANDDLPLFLDAMLFYLRIQADAYTKLVPYFYQGRDGLQIPWRSFRDQLKWFIDQKRARFDPGYTSILGSNCAWFERLAGKGNERGLRDVVVHHSGTLLVAWAKPEGGQIESHTGLAGVGVEADVFRALREINASWCAFLDAVSLHFVKRLVADGILSSADDIKELNGWPYAEVGQSASWVYPVVTMG